MNQVKNFSETYLTEAFQSLRLLEDDINLSDIGDEEDDLTALVPDDVEEETPEEVIIDPVAKNEDQLQDNYAGKVILECRCCHARQYFNAEDVKIEGDIANIEDECPNCGNKLGYNIIGKIEEYKGEEPEEVEDDEVEDEEDEIKNESLREANLSLKDRLARKHLKADESLTESNAWDKLVDTYPELEDGEVYESINESVELTEADFKIGKTRFQIGKQGMPKNIDLSRDGFAQFEDKAMREIKPGNYIHVAELGPNDKGLGYGHYKIHDVSGNGINGKVTLYKADFHKPVKEPGLNYISGITVDSRHPFDTTIGKLMRTNFTIGSNPFTGISENDMSDDEIDSKAYFGGKEYTHKSADELMADYHERNDKAASDNYHATGDKDLYSRDTKANNAILRDFDAAYKLAQQKSDKHITKDWKADQISKRTPLSNKAVKKNLSKYHTDADYRESLSEDLGDDAADFLWEGNKITVDGKVYEIISMGADVLTVEDADGKTVEFDLVELAGKPYSVVDYDGEYYEHKPVVNDKRPTDESLVENDIIGKDDICPECGKNPCECDKHEHHHGHHHCEEGCKVNEARELTADELQKIRNQYHSYEEFMKAYEMAKRELRNNDVDSVDKEEYLAIVKAFEDEQLNDLRSSDDYKADAEKLHDKAKNRSKDLEDRGFYSDNAKKLVSKKVNEAVEVHASGEDAVDVSKNDDGSMTINVGQTQVEGESIVPLSDEDQAALEANSEEEVEEPAEDEFAAEEPVEDADEEEVPTEEGAEEEVEEEESAEEVKEESLAISGKIISESHDISDFNDAKFNDLVEQFLSKVYSNVKSFETTSVHDLNESFEVSGNIVFKSGASQQSKFVFERAYISKRGKLIMEGYNTTFSGNKKAFSIKGALDDCKYIIESMTYNYTSSILNESNLNEVVRICGRVK